MTGAHSYCSWGEGKSREVGPEGVESFAGKKGPMNKEGKVMTS